MTDIKFDPKKLAKLNNPGRLKDIPPEFIQGKIQPNCPEILVDLGAGTAFFSLALLDQLGPRTIYACDLSEVMLSWIRENVSPGHPEIVPVKSEESSVPLDDDIADLVFMIALHHELKAPQVLLEEGYRLLKPGGQILIIDWLKKEMPEGPPESIRCLPETVEGQLVRAGFSSVRIHEGLRKHFMVTGLKSA